MTAPAAGSAPPCAAPLGRDSARVPSLDGWRGVSILLVLVSHFEFSTGFPIGQLGAGGMIAHGDLGVRVFFLLSGFIITHLLLREARETGRVSLKLFYLRRTLRIMPPYFAY